MILECTYLVLICCMKEFFYEIKYTKNQGTIYGK